MAEISVKTYRVVTNVNGTRKDYVLHVSTEIMPIHYITKRDLNEDVAELKAKGYMEDSKTLTHLYR